MRVFEDSNAIGYIGDKQPVYIHVKVSRPDLDKFITSMTETAETPLDLIQADNKGRISLLTLRTLAIERGWPANLDPKTASTDWIKFVDGLRQAMLDGEIATFGRESNSDSHEIVLREPLKPIDANHWAIYSIDPISFVQAKANLCIKSRDAKRVHWASPDSFQDLHVDRDGAQKWLSRFPVPHQAAPALRVAGPVYMTAREVIHYLRDESEWGANKAVEISPRGMRYDVGLEAPFEFARGASEGGVFALGRMDGRGEHVEIPSTYWLSGALDILEALREDGRSRTAPTVLNGPAIYDDVRIKSDDVRSKWPHTQD